MEEDVGPKMTMDSTETKSEDLKGRLCATAPPASVVNLQSVLELNEAHFTDYALKAPWSKIELWNCLLVGSSHGLHAQEDVTTESMLEDCSVDSVTGIGWEVPQEASMSSPVLWSIVELSGLKVPILCYDKGKNSS